MLAFFHKFAEDLIEKAIRNGEFDDLPGRGKPLALEDDSMVPEDMRMAYKILKNSGHVPAEIVEEKEILTMLDLLERCEDEQERYRQIQKLNFMVMQMNMRRNRSLKLEEDSPYYQKLVEKIHVQEKKPAK